MSTKSREQSRELVLVLLRTRDARALFAAALIMVTLTLTVHTRAEALEEAGRAVLYVGAPSVSVPSAREAGAISRSYAKTTSPETLLALGFSENSASRYVVDRALASVTEQPIDPDETITAQAALEAGEIYLAQTGSQHPGETDPGSEGELGSAGPVRPELGDGTVAPAEDLPADVTTTKDRASASDTGENPAHAGGPPDSPVATYPGTSEVDPVALYSASGGKEPMEFDSSRPTNTGTGEAFPEEEPPAAFDTGPISTGEQVPTTLASEQMKMPSSQSGQATEPGGGEGPAALPVESTPKEDAANTPVEAAASHPLPRKESSTTPSFEEPDEQSPAILLTGEPEADEEAPPKASTPDGGDGTPDEPTVGVSQEQRAEEGLEDDTRERVVTIAAGDEPDQSRDVTATDGELRDETLGRPPETERDGETPRVDGAEPTGTTEAPPESKPKQETPPAVDEPDEAAPVEDGPPDRQDERASTERPANWSEANDPRGNPRVEPVTPLTSGRRVDVGRVPASPKDWEPEHGERRTNGRTPRGDASRHLRRPIDVREPISREPRVFSERSTRRPKETLAEDDTRLTVHAEGTPREDAVGPARLERAGQERLAATRAARKTPATFEPMRTKSEDLGHVRRQPLPAGGCGQGSANDGTPDALDASNREEHLDQR